jgi:hypothetical protein
MLGTVNVPYDGYYALCVVPRCLPFCKEKEFSFKRNFECPTPMLGTVNVPYDGYCAAMRDSHFPSLVSVTETDLHGRILFVYKICFCSESCTLSMVFAFSAVVSISIQKSFTGWLICRLMLVHHECNLSTFCIHGVM